MYVILNMFMQWMIMIFMYLPLRFCSLPVLYSNTNNSVRNVNACVYLLAQCSFKLFPIWHSKFLCVKHWFLRAAVPSITSNLAYLHNLYHTHTQKGQPSCPGLLQCLHQKKRWASSKECLVNESERESTASDSIYKTQSQFLSLTQTWPRISTTVSVWMCVSGRWRRWRAGKCHTFSHLISEGIMTEVKFFNFFKEKKPGQTGGNKG